MNKSSAIDQEMDNMAKSLENISKSENTEPNQEDHEMGLLVKAISTMSPAILKAKKHLMNDRQKALFSLALQKAVDIKEAAWGDANKNPQKAKEPKVDKQSNSAEGVDEWDEKMVREANAEQKHQGGQSGNQGAGEWQGEMIKSEEDQKKARAIAARQKAEGKDPKEQKADNAERDEAAGDLPKEGVEKGYNDKDPLSGDTQDGSKHAKDMKIDDSRSDRSKRNLTNQSGGSNTEQYQTDKKQEPLSGDAADSSDKYTDIKVDAAGAAMADMKKQIPYNMTKKHDDKKMTKDEKMYKKQGIPKGVDSAAHERCVKDVKKDPGVTNAYAVCNAAMKKSEIGGEEGFEELKKNLYNKKIEMVKTESEDTKAIMLNQMRHKLHEMKELQEVSYMVEREMPELKDTMEAMYSKLKRECKDAAEKASRLKKGEEMIKGHMLKQMIMRMKERGMDRTKSLDAMKKKGYDHNMCKAYWDAKAEGTYGAEIKEGKKYDASEQVEAAGKKVDLKGDKGMMKKGKKLLIWEDPQKKLLAASTRRGQNCHYESGETIVKADQSYEEFQKSDQFFHNELDDEALEKSKTVQRKVNINDIIEKGMDISPNRLKTARENLNFKHPGQFTHKTVDDAYIAKAMGISKEEADKILGKSEAPQSNAETAESLEKGGVGSGRKKHKHNEAMTDMLVRERSHQSNSEMESQAQKYEQMGDVASHPKSKKDHYVSAASFREAIARRSLKKGGEGTRGGKVIGHTKTGKPVYATTHAHYTDRQKMRGWNTEQSGLSHEGHKILRQKYSDFDKQDHLDASKHHETAKKKASDEHTKVRQAAKEKHYGKDVSDFTLPHISGGVDPKFGDTTNNKIRKLNSLAQEHSSAAHNHKAASKNLRKPRV